MTFDKYQYVRDECFYIYLSRFFFKNVVFRSVALVPKNMSYFIFFKALYPTLCTKQTFKTNTLDYFLKSGKVQGDSVNNTTVLRQKNLSRQTPPSPLPTACLTISDINYFQEITAEEVAELRQELEALEEVAKALLNIVEMLELLEQRVSSGRVRRDDVPAPPTTCEDLTNYIEKIKTSKGVEALPYAIAMDTYFKGVVNEESPYISCESLKAEVKATVEKVEKAKKEVANKIPPVQKISTAEPVDTTTAEPVDTTTAEPDDEVSNTTTAEPIDTTTDIFYLFEMPVKVVYTPSAFF